MFGKQLWTDTVSTANGINKLRTALAESDTVIIGAGAGLSTSAGFTYTGERFQKYFHDFAEKYSFRDMYSGGFYPFDGLEEYWAYWSRYIMVNRYMNAPKSVYQELFSLIKDKDYFVLTTNVDHCFQKAGFDKKRLFYTQGDYGLFQCSAPCHQKTYDNEETVRQMVESQGYTIKENGEMGLPDNTMRETPPHFVRRQDGAPIEIRCAKGEPPKMTIHSELVPHCPICGKPMTMNLRCDDTFVEDEGWHNASERYSLFLRRHQNVKTLFLELGTGMNTPGIVKFSFWRMVHEWPDATYACINLNEAYAPDEIRMKSICINNDIGKVLEQL